MQKIGDLESAIIELVSSNPNAKTAFDKLCLRFLEEAEKDLTLHAEIIKTIYVKRDFNHLWQLCARFFIGESTLSRYRKKYIKWFEYYLNKVTYKR